MSRIPLVIVLALMVGHASAALDGYRPFGDQPVAPWKQTNETVREAGGWRAYAREAQGAASSPAPAASRAASPAPSPHAGHH